MKKFAFVVLVIFAVAGVILAGMLIYDVERRTLIYLGNGDKIITGSPKNTLSAVPLQSREGEAPGAPVSE